MVRFYLERVSTNAGFLQDSPVEFSKKLTCVIGARGTCKSTLIESIRFCLNSYERQHLVTRDRKQIESKEAKDLIDATLGNGTVRANVIQVEGNESLRLTVERDFNSDSRIYIDEVREHTDQSVLDHFEIYSQGDLQRMADGDKNRLVLIDRMHAAEVMRLDGRRRHIGQGLREVGGNLKTVRASIQKLQTDLYDAPLLEEQLAELQRNQPTLPTELETSRSAHLSRRGIVSALNEGLLVQQEALDYLGNTKDFVKPLMEIIIRIDQANISGTTETRASLKGLCNILTSATALVSQILALDLNGCKEELEQIFKDQDKSYYGLQSQQDEINEALTAVLTVIGPG